MFKDVLKQFGFDVECRGTEFFIDIIKEIQSLLDIGLSDLEIIDYLPRCYLENYHFFYEVGANKYFFELDYFLSSCSFSLKSNLSRSEILLYWAKYLNADSDEVIKMKVYK